MAPTNTEPGGCQQWQLFWMLFIYLETRPHSVAQAGPVSCILGLWV